MVWIPCWAHYASKVRKTNDSSTELDSEDAEVKPSARRAAFMPLDEAPISTDLIYGLINIRTDGTRILCAYMKEASQDFDLQVFRAGVEP